MRTCVYLRDARTRNLASQALCFRCLRVAMPGVAAVAGRVAGYVGVMYGCERAAGYDNVVIVGRPVPRLAAVLLSG